MNQETLTLDDVALLRAMFTHRLPMDYSILDALGRKFPFSNQGCFELIQKILRHDDSELQKNDDTYVSYKKVGKKLPAHILKPKDYEYGTFNMDRPSDSKARYLPSFRLGSILKLGEKESGSKSKEVKDQKEEEDETKGTGKTKNGFFNIGHSSLTQNEKDERTFITRMLTQIYGQARHMSYFRHLLALLLSNDSQGLDGSEAIAGFHSDKQTSGTNLFLHTDSGKFIALLLDDFTLVPFTEKAKSIMYSKEMKNKSSILLKLLYQLLETSRSYIHGEINDDLEMLKTKIIMDWSIAPDDNHLDEKDLIDTLGHYLEVSADNITYNQLDKHTLQAMNQKVYKRGGLMTELMEKMESTELKELKRRYPEVSTIISKAKLTTNINYITWVSACYTLSNPGDYIKGSPTVEFTKSSKATAPNSEFTVLENFTTMEEYLAFDIDTSKLNDFSKDYLRTKVGMLVTGMRSYMDEHGEDSLSNPESSFIKALTHKGSGTKRKSAALGDSNKRTLDFIRNYQKYQQKDNLFTEIMQEKTYTSLRWQKHRRTRVVVPVTTPRQTIHYCKYFVEEAALRYDEHTSSKRNRGNANDSKLLFHATTHEALLSELDVRGMDTSIAALLYAYNKMAVILALIEVGPRIDKYFCSSSYFITINGRRYYIPALADFLMRAPSNDACAEVILNDILLKGLGSNKNDRVIQSNVFPTGGFDTSTNHTSTLLALIKMAEEKLYKVLGSPLDVATKLRLLEITIKVTFDINQQFSLDHSVQGDDIILAAFSDDERFSNMIVDYVDSVIAKSGLNLNKKISKIAGTYLQRRVMLGVEMPQPMRSGIYTEEKLDGLDLDFHTRWSSWIQQVLLLGSRSCFTRRLMGLLFSSFMVGRYLTIKSDVVGAFKQTPSRYITKSIIAKDYYTICFPFFYLQLAQLLPMPQYVTKYCKDICQPNIFAPLSKFNHHFIGKYFRKGTFDWDLELLEEHGYTMASHIIEHLPRISDIRTNRLRIDEVKTIYKDANVVYGSKDYLNVSTAQERLARVGIRLPKTVNALYAPENVLIEALTTEKLKDEIIELDRQFVEIFSNYITRYPRSSWMHDFKFIETNHKEVTQRVDGALFLSMPLKAYSNPQSMSSYLTYLFGPPQQEGSLISKVNSQLEILTPRGVNSLRLAEMVFEFYHKYASPAMVRDILISAGVKTAKISRILTYLSEHADSSNDVVALHVLGHAGNYYYNANLESENIFFDPIEGRRSKRINAVTSLFANYIFSSTYPLTKKIDIALPFDLLSRINKSDAALRTGSIMYSDGDFYTTSNVEGFYLDDSHLLIDYHTLEFKRKRDLLKQRMEEESLNGEINSSMREVLNTVASFKDRSSK